MKHSILLAMFFALLLTVTALHSQQQEITEGKEYWLGIPHCRLAPNEPIRFGEYPIMLWLSSKVNTTAKITAEAIGFIKSVEIRANRTTIVEMNDILMPKVSEEILPYGIHVVSEDPITVAVYMAYKWSGEAFRCIPIEWLGKKYITTNLYLDQTNDYKPPQIMIIATENNTSVSYRPAANTVKVKKGQTRSVTMQKGEVMLIEGDIESYKNLKREWVTDLTGTFITASKPIAVLSGHTKGAFPRYQRGMPPNYVERWANFMRNMLIEMLWPIEFLGNEYISAPIKYFDRPRGRSFAVDDFGDLIRFVAVEDNTDIYQMRNDGSGFKKISPTLKAGEWFNVTNQEYPGYYRSTKPVLAAQYGKSWMNEQVPSGADEKTKSNQDEIQNPRRNGQGMLLILAPIDRWCGYAQFRSPQGMDNFVYMTFEEHSLNHLRFDGQPLTAKFGNAIMPVAGTKYVYITETVAAGDHYIEADSGYKFAGYAYGNWDYTKDGFAYGYPVGINYASTCDDSIYVVDKELCGDVTGTAYVVPADSSCALLFSIKSSSSQIENYDFDVQEFDREKAKVANYWLKIIDIKKYAKAVITSMTRSGKSVTRTYEYYPEEIKAEPEFIHFGRLKIGEKVCKDIKFTNVSKGNVLLEFKSLKQKFNKPEFSIESNVLPKTLKPGESIMITVCATALPETPKVVFDSLIAELKCYSETLVRLEMTTGEEILWIDDATWVNVPVGMMRSKQVEIRNEGTLPATIHSISWPDKLRFPKVDNLPLPLTLEPNKSHFFTAFYIPDEPGVVHKTRADFKATTDVIKLYSDWVGNGIQAGPWVEGFDFLRQRVIDEYSVNKLGIDKYEGIIKIGSSGNTTLECVDLFLENNFDGVFELDKTGFPATINPQDTMTFKVYFRPKPDELDAITDYTTKVRFITKFIDAQQTLEAEDIVHGAELQPHIAIEGYEFKPALLIGQSLDGNGKVISVLKNNDSKMDLTVTNLWIEGPDMNSFEIDKTFLNANLPLTISPTEEVNIPIKFTAAHPGKHNAILKAEHNAPEDPAGILIGWGKTQGLYAIDRDFGTHYITLPSQEDFVYLENTGSDEITITSPIMVSGDDINEFSIQRWYIESTNQQNPIAPFNLKPNDKLIVYVKFTPQEVKDYKAQINYKTDVGDEVSKLTGRGMIFKIIARIPKDYRSYPGKLTIIDVIIDKHPEESKLLESTNIREFDVIVQFKEDGRPKEIEDVYPNVNSPQDIITDNTLTEGWTINSANIFQGKYLKVSFNANKSLSGSGVLFKFPLLTYLTDVNKVTLPLSFEPINKPYVLVENEPGEILIDPVCVNTLRLIKISGIQYGLSNVSPNPSEGKANIEYSIALKAQTKITLIDNGGKKLFDLLNEELEPGYYDLTIDVNRLSLPSGTYLIHFESGPYSDVRSFVVIK